MDELFGIPLGTLLAILVGATGAGIGVLAVLALRNRMLVRLAVRNAGRRRARTALIVTGLMLGTTIVAAALTTGDTMARTIRQTAVTAMGSTDEVVAAAGSMADVPGEVGDATGPRYVDASIVPRIDAALRREGLTDGVTGAIVAPVALQAPTRRQAEPRVTLFAADPARMAGFDAIHGSDGEVVTLASLGIADGYLNQEAADALTVRPGDVVDVFAGGSSTMRVRVRDVVRFDGAGTADEALLVPLATAQRLLGATGRVQHVLISNRGDDLGGVGLSDRVVRTLAPVVQPLGLEVTTVKRDAIDDAETAGTTFMAMFTTFGSFSIAAGVLLIFLIFVMLAAERRGELGIARAIGTRRGHLVELFVFEGVAYDLLAALVGAILGAAIAFGMVAAIAGAISATEADLDVVYAVSPRSLLVAFLLGVLLTVVVVTVSAWRVSRMTISTAIRNLPEPPAHRRRSRWLLGIVAIVLGVLLVLGGGSQATPLLLGISLVLVGLVPIARALGAPERPTFTLAGLLLVVIWMLPWRVWDTVFGELRMDFGTWITAGLMVVVGAVWLIVFNADVLIRLTIRVFGRVGRVAPVIRVAAAYPAAARFRTATTLAMFTLVVFTLVTGVAAPGSFQAALEDVDRSGGGYDVRAATSGGAPIDDLAGAIRRTPGLRAADYTSVGSQSMLQVQARQLGTDRPEEA
ncbi:MAG: ABC transporter permease, partial [Pseudomonadota bacterium]